MLHKTVRRVSAGMHATGGDMPWWVWPLLPIAGLGLMIWWLRGRRIRETEVHTPRYIPLKSAPSVKKTQETAPAAGTAQEPTHETPAASTAPQEPAQEIPIAKSAPDDLKRIEGIGPKIAQLLQEHGISTYAQLAATDGSRLLEILTAARLQHLARPETWAEQAALAAQGDWDALQALKDQLKGGKRA